MLTRVLPPSATAAGKTAPAAAVSIGRPGNVIGPHLPVIGGHIAQPGERFADSRARCGPRACAGAVIGRVDTVFVTGGSVGCTPG